jgi:CRP/FNR family nitrogen fixation transcriptional regulator
MRIPNPTGGDVPALQRIATKARYGRNEMIFGEGDPADYTYKLVSGAVRLCKHMADGRRQIADFVLPGDYFGFAQIGEYSFSAEAVGEVVVLCYPQRQIEALGDENPGIRKQFTTILVKRLLDMQNHIVMLGRKTAKERLVSFLLMLADRSGTAGGIIDVPMSRQDIADYLGLTIETVCRVLSDMKRSRLIDLPNLHQVALRNIDALYALSDGTGEAA